MGSDKKVNVTISAPKIRAISFPIIGTAPLVLHRFSIKVKKEMREAMEKGNTGSRGKKALKPVDFKENFQMAKYVHADGWEGFNASAIRKAMISACRLARFKMTIAKLSIFVIEDGWDMFEPEFPLVKIKGKARSLVMPVILSNGSPMMCARPCYDKWEATLNLRYDSDQFSDTDIANLVTRVGMQVGIGEGRPDSKNSAGMGWGTFEIKLKKKKGK